MRYKFPDRPPKTLLQASGAILVLVAAISLALSFRNRKIDDLTSKGLLFDSKAVEQLQSYKGGQAAASLLEIAEHSVLEGNRIQAIRYLQGRGGPEVSIELANLLRPQEGFNVRKAVAETLMHRECPAGCISAILRYEDRVFDGEQPAEALGFNDPSTGDTLRRKESELGNNLDAVLARESQLTIQELVQVYGISSWPSSFGVELAARLKLKDACVFLQRSAGILQGPMFESEGKLRGELSDALKQLECPQPER
jgi:hypothetical protein